MNSVQSSRLEGQEAVEDFQKNFTTISDSIAQTVVGHKKIIQGILIAFLGGGHVLLEGLPGLGKTLLMKTLAEVVSLEHRRIQFTPDLMPADIIGTKVIQENSEGRGQVKFEAGPIFSHIVLADEINRATPKTQSALLQAMQESKVTVANTTYNLPDPFIVVATQNPIEMEGTYPLPEAQLDRFFFKLRVSVPTLDELIEIADRTTQGEKTQKYKKISSLEIQKMKQYVQQVKVHPDLTKYAAQLVLSTHNAPSGCPLARRYVSYGASPRGLQSIILGAKAHALCCGRVHVSEDDITQVIIPALEHRIILNFEGEASEITPIDIIEEALKQFRI